MNILCPELAPKSAKTDSVAVPCFERFFPLLNSGHASVHQNNQNNKKLIKLVNTKINTPMPAARTSKVLTSENKKHITESDMVMKTYELIVTTNFVQ